MKKVLITGGSQGIGYELARLFSMDGYEVYLCARNQEKLAAAEAQLCDKAGTDSSLNIHTLSIDLCEPCAAATLYAWSGPVDVLINNAGMGTAGRSWEINNSLDASLLRLNVEALVFLCKQYLPAMIAAHAGTIINIGSTAAFQPGPYASTYYASKAFVVNYSLALHEEAAPYGVSVCCYCPGPVKTSFYEKEGVPATVGAISAASAAKHLYDANWKKALIVPGIGNHLMRLVPSGLRMKVVGNMKKKIIR